MGQLSLMQRSTSSAKIRQVRRSCYSPEGRFGLCGQHPKWRCDRCNAAASFGDGNEQDVPETSDCKAGEF